MQTAPTRRFVFLCASVVLTTLASGCAVGGKSFSMDSNSRVPFFGLELKERKAKSSGPAFSTISRAKSDQPRFDAAVQSGASGSKMTFKRGNELLIAQSVPETAATELDETPATSVVVSQQAEGVKPISLPLDGLTNKSVPVRTVSSDTANFH